MLDVKEKRKYLKDDILEKLDNAVQDYEKSNVILEQKILDQQYRIDCLNNLKNDVKAISIDEFAISKKEMLEMIWNLVIGGMLD